LEESFSDDRQGIPDAGNLGMIGHQARDFGSDVTSVRETPNWLRRSEYKKKRRAVPHRCQDFGNLCVQSIKAASLSV
jgi:hypothetical protein